MLIPHMVVEVVSLVVDRIGLFLLWVVVDLMLVEVARLLMDLGKVA